MRFNDNLHRTTELHSNQNGNYIEEMILLILKEQKVSLSQTRGIFNRIIENIEDANPITL